MHWFGVYTSKLLPDARVTATAYSDSAALFGLKKASPAPEQEAAWLSQPLTLEIKLQTSSILRIANEGIGQPEASRIHGSRGRYPYMPVPHPAWIVLPQGKIGSKRLQEEAWKKSFLYFNAFAFSWHSQGQLLMEKNFTWQNLWWVLLYQAGSWNVWMLPGFAKPSI